MTYLPASRQAAVRVALTILLSIALTASTSTASVSNGIQAGPASAAATDPAAPDAPAALAKRQLTLMDEVRRTAKRADEDKVFAHYFPPYPISLDNEPPAEDYYARNYLTIDGESGKHRAYGGLLRDRPIGRPPLGGNWQIKDMRTEIRQAVAAGIDGFTLDILGLSGRTWEISRTLMRAADIEGFEIIPTLDAASIESTPAAAAAAFATLFAHPSAQKFGNEHVLASFLAEGETVLWWKKLIRLLERKHDTPVKFIAVFNDPSDANMAAFAPFSYALSSWGYRNASGAAATPDFVERAHALGVKWMHSVAVQDARPRSGLYAEAGNTDTLRTTWARAIDDGADLVQIVTWNDYSETTAIAPSFAHGSVYLALMSYFAAWFTDGEPPAISQDHLFLTHRRQPWQANARSGIKNMVPTLGDSIVEPRNKVEALVMLSAPAEVTVTSGSRTKTVLRPAGTSKVLLTLGLGRPEAQITRESMVVKSVRSPYPVVESPIVQDMQYFASGS